MQLSNFRLLFYHMFFYRDVRNKTRVCTKGRITLGVLGKRLDILAMLERYLDKLPLTKELLMNKQETVEDYQLRRINYLVDAAKDNNVELAEWKIHREAGIRKNCSYTVKERIKKLVL